MSAGEQRISLGIADAVGLDVNDFAVVDDSDGDAVGVGSRHELAHFGVNRGSARNCLGSEYSKERQEIRTCSYKYEMGSLARIFGAMRNSRLAVYPARVSRGGGLPWVLLGRRAWLGSMRLAGPSREG